MSTPTERLDLLEAAAKSAEAEAAILAALEDGASVVRERAIRLAARYVEPAVLAELVADGENAIRRNAGLAALERQGPYAVPHLTTMLSSPDPELVMFALQSLSRIGDAAAGPAILPLLHRRDPNVAQAAIEAAGQLRIQPAVPDLIRLLAGDLWLQLAAIAALGEIGDTRAVGPLMALVPDSVVAEPAVQAVRRIAAPESLEPLLALLPKVRERALRDPLLLALGVVIELHPDPTPAAMRVCGELGDAMGELSAYLRQLITAPPDAEDAGETESLFRAATTLVAAAGIEELEPLLLARLAVDEAAGWIEGLFRRFPDGIGSRLEQLVEQADPDVRCGALRAGAFGEDDLSRVIVQLSDPHEHIRAAACHALGYIGLDAVAPLLIERLRRGEPLEQTAAAQALTHLSVAALGELEGCLEPDTDESVASHALDVLSRCPVPALEARIVRLTESRSPAVRGAALRAAALIPGPAVDVILLRALADRHAPIQRQALELLVRRGGEKSVATMVVLLETADSLRFHVIRALGHCRAPSAAEPLRSLYPRCGPHEQLQIVWSLIRIAPTWITAFLRERLAEPSLEMRRAAAQGLSEVAGVDQLPVLIPLAADADWNIRNEAARALGRLGTPETRVVLLTLVRDVESVVAATARASLELLPRQVARIPA
jgi:HEAT repeat protein